MVQLALQDGPVDLEGFRGHLWLWGCDPVPMEKLDLAIFIKLCQPMRSSSVIGRPAIFFLHFNCAPRPKMTVEV